MRALSSFAPAQIVQRHQERANYQGDGASGYQGDGTRAQSGNNCQESCTSYQNCTNHVSLLTLN
jgi:hypothetical protein